MNHYPTHEQVDTADRIQLARWVRFLKSPGMSYIDNHEHVRMLPFEECLKADMLIMDRIIQRFNSMGGFTPAISKAIGWGS
jgi:hypothetical protein